jgi:uncharacterized protein (DUF488 family)
MNDTNELDASIRSLRRKTIDMVLKRTGPDGQIHAERAADEMVKHYQKLLEAGADVVMADVPPAVLSSIAEQSRDHSQTIINTAMSCLAMSLILGLEIGIRHRE